MYCIYSVCLVAQSCPALCDPMDYSPPGSSIHGDSPGKNTGVGCHALLQGIYCINKKHTGICLLFSNMCILCHIHKILTFRRLSGLSVIIDNGDFFCS